MTERRVLAWMCVLIGVNQLGFGAVIPVLPLYAQSFDVSQLAIGATVAVYGLARVVLSVPTGWLADRAGRRVALLAGGLLSAVGNVWCGLAGSYEELVVARFVAGGGAGIVVTAGMIVLADISVPANRGRTMAIYQGVFLFSVGIGPFPGGFLAERVGLEAPFLVYGVASVAAAIVGWFGVAETRRVGQVPSMGPAPRLRTQLWTLAGNVSFLLVCLVGFMHAAARTGALFSVVPILAQQRLALTATEVGFGFALGSILGLAVTYPAGALVDRYGRKAVIVPATLLTSMSMLTFSLAPGYFWFLLATAVWGSAAAASGAAPAAYAADVGQHRSNRSGNTSEMNAAAISGYRTLSDLGYVVGPVLLGVVADQRGVDAPMWIAAVALAVTAVLFGTFATETHRRVG